MRRRIVSLFVVRANYSIYLVNVLQSKYLFSILLIFMRVLIVTHSSSCITTEKANRKVTNIFSLKSFISFGETLPILNYCS